MLCVEKCCTIYTREYIDNQIFEQKFTRGGAFIYDPLQKKILLVQSKGLYWGCPKGSSFETESLRDCAIREVKEETGMDLSLYPVSITYFIVEENGKLNCVKDQDYRDEKILGMYYYIEMNSLSSNAKLQENDNTTNGLAWIKLNCLKKMIQEKHLKINHHTRLLCKTILGCILL